MGDSARTGVDADIAATDLPAVSAGLAAVPSEAPAAGAWAGARSVGTFVGALAIEFNAAASGAGGGARSEAALAGAAGCSCVAGADFRTGVARGIGASARAGADIDPAAAGTALPAGSSDLAEDADAAAAGTLAFAAAGFEAVEAAGETTSFAAVVAGTGAASLRTKAGCADADRGDAGASGAACFPAESVSGIGFGLATAPGAALLPCAASGTRADAGCRLCTAVVRAGAG